jgi:hypothetical protein
MAIHAVLTGDIVNFMKLPAANEKKLLKALHRVLASQMFEFYRGDSFQAYQKNASEALKTVLLCRASAISLAPEDEMASFDVRVSIGIGQVKEPVKTVNTARGEAFILSGRAFDELANKQTKLTIITSNALANEGLQVIAEYINAIFNTMTRKQAKVIFELLKGQTQLAVAKKLKKSTSTINQHVSSGKWAEIEKLLLHYENIINQLTCL